MHHLDLARPEDWALRAQAFDALPRAVEDDILLVLILRTHATPRQVGLAGSEAKTVGNARSSARRT